MKNQLPSSPVHVDMMKTNGSFLCNVAFADMDEASFLKLIKMNHALGESYAEEGFYMCSLIKLYGKTLLATPYYSQNYPEYSGRVSLCLSKYIIVSPCPQNDEDKLLYFNSLIKNGVIILNDDSPESSPKCGQKWKLDSDDYSSDTVRE